MGRLIEVSVVEGPREGEKSIRPIKAEEKKCIFREGLCLSTWGDMRPDGDISNSCAGYGGCEIDEGRVFVWCVESSPQSKEWRRFKESMGAGAWKYYR